MAKLLPVGRARHALPRPLTASSGWQTLLTSYLQVYVGSQMCGCLWMLANYRLRIAVHGYTKPAWLPAWTSQTPRNQTLTTSREPAMFSCMLANSNALRHSHKPLRLGTHLHDHKASPRCCGSYKQSSVRHLGTGAASRQVAAGGSARSLLCACAVLHSSKDAGRLESRLLREQQSSRLFSRCRRDRPTLAF